MLHLAPRAARFAAIALAFAPCLLAQGYSYDMKNTSSGEGRRGGDTATKTTMTAHGQFDKGSSRIDFVESSAPGGMMGAGSYMITNAAKGTTTFVDPAKKTYMEMNPAEMAKQAASLQQAMGGMAKIEILDLHVEMQDLGAGEKLEGYATHKYRLTESYTMNITVLGSGHPAKTSSVSEIWIAPELNGIMNPTARPAPPAAAATGYMAELMDKTYKAYAIVKPGVMLKTVTTSTAGEGAKAKTSVTTMTISNVKRASISPSVFQVPAGYTKTESPFDALKPATDAMDSVNAAKAHASSTHAQAAPAPDDPAQPTGSSLLDSAAAGVKQGATDAAKAKANSATKKALGGLLGVPVP